MDSKKLEEIAEILRQELKKNIPQVVLNKETLTDIAESIQGLYVPLEIRLAEQDREIERLRNQTQQTNRDWRDNHIYLLERAEKAEAEVSACKEQIRELVETLGNTHRRLKEITTYPVAMQALGKITKDRIDGAIYIAEQALQAQEQSKEGEG